MDEDYTIQSIAAQLEAEVPYATCSKLWTHESWVDLVRTIQQTCPRAFLEMVKTYTT